MKGTSLALAIGFCLPALAQPGRIMGGNASRGNVEFSYETRLEPPAPRIADGLGGGVLAGPSGMHRYMADRSRRMYFGYDLVIEPLSEANTFRVTFRPLSIGADKMNVGDPAKWTMLALPGYPAPQVVHGGDTIALDLLANAATGQKIVDYVRIQNPARRTYFASGAARDFSAEDAEMRVAEPRLSVNGVAQEATADFGGSVSGAAVWFYRPDQGRYILSLVPHPSLGFRKAGEVRGSSLKFTLGSDLFVLHCNGRIAPGYSAYNLYVVHDATWRPKGEDRSAAFLLGSADRADMLVQP